MANEKVEKGDTVHVLYEGRFENGEVFDSSEKHGNQPLVFEVGKGMVVKGFDSAVEGMKEGEEKEVKIKPEDGYGEHREDLKQKIPRDVLPKDQEPKSGMILMASAPNGQQMAVKIIDVDDKEITVDMNHPLAGKTLIFKIKIDKIEKNSSKE